MKVSLIPAVILGLISLSLPACRMHEVEKPHHDHQEIVVTSPMAKDVTITQQYVCQIRAKRNIEVRALEEGYLDVIPVKEGQRVKEGELMFKVRPMLYEARLAAEKAEAQLAELELGFTKKLREKDVVAPSEVLLYEAKLARAKAKREQAQVELNFTEVKAPFEGIIDRLYQMQGSLVKKEEILTTLSDNSVMWVYFNVPEARYLEYMARRETSQQDSQLKLPDSRIELVLANGSTFNQSAGDTITVEGKFNNETGNIQFRADFPNPEGLLRHGQTGTVLIHQRVRDAIVIPQRATFEVLDKRYVYVVGEDNVVHQRPIVVEHELDDIFIVKSGLSVNDRIILEGIRQVENNTELEKFDFRKPEDALANQKNHAE